MEAARPVTRFAAHILRVIALRFEPRMRRRFEIPHDRFVAGRAFFRPDKLGAGNARWREDRAVRFKRAAGKQNDGERGCSPDCPQQFFAFTVKPPS